jgi:hypothetical protein
MTSFVNRRMQKYMDDENLMPKSRRGAAADQKNANISC